MRIGIDMAAAVNQRAGIGRYARGVLGEMAPLLARDWVLAVAPRPNATAYAGAGNGDGAGAGAQPQFVRGRSVRLPVSERQLWIAWQRLRLPLPPDLLAPRLDVFYNPDFVLPRLAYAGGVCTVHDLGFMTVPDCAFPKLRDLLLRAVPWTLERARLVIAVSEHTRRDLIDLLGVPAAKVRVAGNAAGALFRPIRDRPWLELERRRLSLPDRPFLLAVGTLEPRKNLVRLFEALAALKGHGRAGHAVPLVVAGREGWLYEPIYEAVHRLGLTEEVRFMHGPSDTDLLALYNLAAVMVFPSLYEGFGVPPLEALACGAVVVCSRTSSLPEVVGDAALLVDPYDVAGMAGAIARALDDAALRADLAVRGPQQARRYSWQASAASVVAALREAAA